MRTRGFSSDVACRVAIRPHRIAILVPRIVQGMDGFSSDVACRVATVFENLNCMIKTYLLARSEKTSYIKIAPLRAFCRDPLPSMPIT